MQQCCNYKVPEMESAQYLTDPQSPWNPTSRALVWSAGLHLALLGLFALGSFWPFGAWNRAGSVALRLPVELVGRPAPTKRASLAARAHPQPRASLATGPTVPSQGTASEPLAAQESAPGQVGASAGNLLEAYLGQIVQRVNAAKGYPEDALFRGEEGRVVVALQLERSGAVSHFDLVEPCPFEALNHAALDTVARLAKQGLPPLPEALGNSLRVLVPLNYELAHR